MKLNHSLTNVLQPAVKHLETAAQPLPTTHFSVCVITQFFPPDYAPTGQLIDELTQSLSQQNVRIKIFSGQPGYAFRSNSAPALEQRNQVHVKRSRVAQIWPERIRGKAINGLLFSIRAGLHLLKAHRHYDVLLVTTAPPFLPVLGYLMHWLFKTPYVCLIYDLYPDIAIELGVVSPQHWLARLWKKLNHHIWRQAQGVIVVSDSMKQRIASYCPDVAEKITVIHSWANPDSIVPIPKQKNWFAWRYDLIDDFTVLYSGNMGRCHDIDTILEAARLLKHEPIQFVFIGGGPQRTQSIEKARYLQLSNCLFLPYQDKDILPYSLTACDLSLVSVSARLENLVAPSKFYSALAAGRPIAAICPDHSYLNQLIAAAGCGSTFVNGDSRGLAEFIRCLSKDTIEAERMGANGRKHLERNFTPEIIAEQYFNVLQHAPQRNSQTVR